jgi:hypothetical protein
VIDNALRPNRFVLFRATETRAAAAGDDDGPDNLDCGERHDRRG